MKKLIWTFIAALTFFGSFAQRYEVWVGTPEYKRIKGNYGFSNDSVLMLYSNPSLLFPSKDKYFSWDDVNSLKIRNKSKNQLGQIIGAGAGVLATAMINNSIKKSGEPEIASFLMILYAPIMIGAGTLIGHLATNKRTKIPLHGFDSKDKNKLLKSSMKKRNRAKRKLSK